MSSSIAVQDDKHRATVIGATGFIGGQLVHYLSQLGWECLTPERGSMWPRERDDLGHVFYCAGFTADYLHQPAQTIEAHVGLLSRVLQSTSYQSLVYLSSTRLYDGLAANAIAKESLALSVSSVQARHFYDISKLAGESLCSVMGNGKARVVRLSCVYDTVAAATGFLPSLLRQVAAARVGDEIVIESSPAFARDYVHITDVLRGMKDIAMSGVQPIYNLASGVNTSNAELAQWIERHSGRKIVFNMDTVPVAAPRVDVAIFKSDFGWTPSPPSHYLTQWLRGLP